MDDEPELKIGPPLRLLLAVVLALGAALMGLAMNVGTPLH
jgi:hypothetical protein